LDAAITLLEQQNYTQCPEPLEGGTTFVEEHEDGTRFDDEDRELRV